MRRTRTGGQVLAVVAGVLLAGCGAHDVDRRTFVGPVLEVDEDMVCIGGTEASGECFLHNELTRGLAVGDCVEASYRTDVRERGGYTVEELHEVDAQSHRTDCPD